MKGCKLAIFMRVNLSAGMFVTQRTDGPFPLLVNQYYSHSASVLLPVCIFSLSTHTDTHTDGWIVPICQE